MSVCSLNYPFTFHPLFKNPITQFFDGLFRYDGGGVNGFGADM